MRVLLQKTVRALPKGAARTSKQKQAPTTGSSKWGQECSVDCGCILQFEQQDDQQVSYTAKRLVVDRQGNPQRTTRTGRPLLQSCSCTTLHTLAGRLIHHANSSSSSSSSCRTQQEASAAGRSSLAVRHAVLAAANRPRTDTHCFDLVEGAWTAMMYQRPLLARPTQERNLEYGAFLKMQLRQAQYGHAPGSPLVSPQLGGVISSSGIVFDHDFSSSSENSSDDISALQDHVDESHELWKKKKAATDSSVVVDDWVSYVDEQEYSESM